MVFASKKSAIVFLFLLILFPISIKAQANLDNETQDQKEARLRSKKLNGKPKHEKANFGYPADFPDLVSIIDPNNFDVTLLYLKYR